MHLAALGLLLHVADVPYLVLPLPPQPRHPPARPAYHTLPYLPIHGAQARCSVVWRQQEPSAEGGVTQVPAADGGTARTGGRALSAESSLEGASQGGGGREGVKKRRVRVDTPWSRGHPTPCSQHTGPHRVLGTQWGAEVSDTQHSVLGVRSGLSCSDSVEFTPNAPFLPSSLALIDIVESPASAPAVSDGSTGGGGRMDSSDHRTPPTHPLDPAVGLSWPYSGPGWGGESSARGTMHPCAGYDPDTHRAAQERSCANVHAREVSSRPCADAVSL